VNGRLRNVGLPKGLVWLACGAPLIWLLQAVVRDVQRPGAVLGADPGEAVVLFLGEWGIRMLLLALAVTPLRRWLQWPALARVRRLVGLFAFTYLALHFLAYLGFLAAFQWPSIVQDLTERRYITVGALALLALLPLAVTSTRRWQRRLGRRWRSLHRLVFVAVALGLVHLWWLTKDGYGEVLAYSVVFLILMGERLNRWRQHHGRSGEAGLRALQR
jgi:methionine sulfoxide reductase heme-binding subunit